MHILFTLDYYSSLGIDGKDSVPWAFQAFKDERKKKPCLIAWIHSHVRGAECCFSSIDNHTQYAYSKVHNAVLGLVIEIDLNGKKGVEDFFEMSKSGKAAIETCSRKKDCITNQQHDSCSDRMFYQSAAHKVIFDDFFSVNVKNFMDKQTKENQIENDSDFQRPSMTAEEHEKDESSQETMDIQFIQCKNLANCKTKSKKILMHLAKSKICKAIYSAKELAQLETARDKDKKAYKRKYNEDNSDIIKSKQRKYDQENANIKIVEQAQYNKRNAKKIAENQSQYDKKNAKKIKERQSKYNKKNAKNIAESQSQYNKKNAKKIAENQSQYNKRNAKKITKNQSQYNKKNAKKIAEKQSQYNKKNASQIAEKQKARREIAKRNRTQEDKS